ncbi:MAG: GNAT family N-acetyltransferase [Pseudomonadales bacterium]|nr:GNAT family N-acetyltransferase [Pseudomonadales bacterium]
MKGGISTASLCNKIVPISNLNIRVLSMDDWGMYKSLRLGSLEDSPDSFGSTLERETAYPDEEWMSRLDPSDRAASALPLVAELNNVPCGLAWGVVHDKSSKVAHVYQMWVKPDARNRGVGRKLLEAIILWARDSHLRSLALAVTTTNKEAVWLYRSSGFLSVGGTEPLRPGSVLMVQPMILEISANVA